jgi:LAO/AO transport system kinase
LFVILYLSSLDQDTALLFQKITDGDRVALGLALTLVESERQADRKKAVVLLDLCEKKNAILDDSIIFTISGSPGAGKSTLIESLGTKAITEGHKVGVLTVDPTSSVSYGSILGDKSRMQNLSVSPSAFVRSSPAGSLLGGISRRSKEMMTLLVAAGYDLIFLETVGVGQSEHIAWQLTDGFILVIQPGSGDELQGIKRGITELADIIVINKADSNLKEASAITRGHFQNAIHYFSPLREAWQPKVLTCSAKDGTGIDEFWEILRLYKKSRFQNNQVKGQRRQQDKFWLTWSLGITAHQLLMNHPVVNQKVTEGLSNIEHREHVYRTEFEIEEAMRLIINTPYTTQ